MTSFLSWVLLVFGIELLANVILFPVIARASKVAKGSRANKWFCSWRDFWKGELERSMLMLGLWVGVPQVFILFGALKIGSHIKDDKSEVPNDYFLIGNVTSVLLCLIYEI
jgi:hypothetical protein